MSVGKKGSIRKLVEFTPLNQEGTLYNLGFGDVNPITGDWDDKVVSNNGDRNKVLATVANLVVDFLEENPSATIFAKGSTPNRNLLHQRTIERFWNEIIEMYEVQGLTEHDTWISFERKEPFSAFLIMRK